MPTWAAGAYNWEQEPSFGGKVHPQALRCAGGAACCHISLLLCSSLHFCFKGCFKIKAVASLNHRMAEFEAKPLPEPAFWHVLSSSGTTLGQKRSRSKSLLQWDNSKISKRGNNLPHLLKNLQVNKIIKEGPQIRTTVETYHRSGFQRSFVPALKFSS